MVIISEKTSRILSLTIDIVALIISMVMLYIELGKDEPDPISAILSFVVIIAVLWMLIYTANRPPEPDEDDW